MPINPAIVGAGIGLAGQLINAGSTTRNNESSQNHNFNMARYQNQENIRFWEMQNAYNSPQAQMQRLKDAGLNPNLVYGASAPGNSAGQVHAASPAAWQPKAPQFDLGSVMDTYFNIAMQSAQLDNVKATNNKIVAETAAISATAGLKNEELSFSSQYYGNRASKMMGDAGISRANANIAEQTMDEKIATAELQLKKLGIETQIQQAVKSGKSLDNTLKQLEVDLQKNGLSSKDPAIMRVIGRIISQFFDLSNFKFK